MRILALDTSTEYCSVALLVGEQCIERSEFAGQRHSELLLPMVRALLSESGIRLEALDACAVGVGPGSFTGLRIGCGVAQGLAFAARLPAVGVCSLQAIAETQRLRSGSTRVLAALDARMREVYVAAYAYQATAWTTVLAPAVMPPEAVSLPVMTGAGVVRWQGAGNGFAAYPGLRDRLVEEMPVCDPTTLPAAAFIARLGRAGFEHGEAVDARDLAPLYVRHRVALTTAEREAGARL